MSARHVGQNRFECTLCITLKILIKRTAIDTVHNLGKRSQEQTNGSSRSRQMGMTDRVSSREDPVMVTQNVCLSNIQEQHTDRVVEL